MTIHRSSPKFSHEPVNQFFYHLWGLSGEDEQAGGDSMTSYALFIFSQGIDPESIDSYNADVNVEDCLNASEIVMLCTEMVGGILHETTDGFVSVDLYATDESIQSAWHSILEATMLETCDICHQSADEYGKDTPIRHADGCRLAD